MSEKNGAVPAAAPPGHEREARAFSHYIIPLTVSLVVAVFVTLILIMGFMDLRRLDKALVEFMENRGLDIVTTIENVAQEDLDFLRRVLQDDRSRFGFSPMRPLSEQDRLIQDRLISALYEVARDIDSHWQKDELTEADLADIAVREKLSIIVVLDERDRIVMKSREFRQDTPAFTSGIYGDLEELAREIFKTLGALAEMGLISLRRKDGSGTILLALDAGKLKYWGTKIAVKRVISEIGWEQELAYLSVADLEGTVIGNVGEHPERTILTTDLLAQEAGMARHRGVLSRKHVMNDSHFLEIIAPVHLDGTMVGHARLGLKWDRARGILAENRNRMILTTLFIVLIGTLATAALYRNQSRQLDRMNDMQKRLQRAEHLSALGRLAAGVAHEIRNPLNAISIATQRLQREFSPGDAGEKNDFQRISGIIRSEIGRLNDIIEEFVMFFRIRRMQLRPHSLEGVLHRTLQIMETECTDRGIAIRATLNAAAVPVYMDSDKLTQALYNILKNAMEAISGPGTISVTVERRQDSQVAISISDTGVGMEAEEIERIFSPEYTTKEKGLGLGLMLAHEIIDGHRGEIQVTSARGAGTTFTILLPLEPPPMDEPETRSVSS